MLDSPFIFHLLCAVMQFLIGIFANGIILIVNGADLIKNRRMSPLELLLSFLAISRIGLQWSVFYTNLCFLSFVDFSVYAKNFFLFLFINESGLWFATWLGVFYCVKIANIAHPFFSWLRRRISKLVPWLILGSLLYSLITSTFNHKDMWSNFKNNWLNYFSKNSTSQIKEMSPLQLSFFVLQLSLPLLIFFAAVLLLMFSLVRHSRQMRNAVVGTRESSTRTHISAALSLLSFLILYVSHYMMTALQSFGVFKTRDLIFLFYILMLGTYPSLHSIILILGNPKLKQNAKKFLLHSKCCQ
ncbi:taste receptor type 2 member 1 [Tamandua tetradactyla]|uniref:taste receptor type 2 member 1 n=1 Tax=Tamandua tetradactyla TaxID=48850 RepID=UPI0040546941